MGEIWIGEYYKIMGNDVNIFYVLISKIILKRVDELEMSGNKVKSVVTFF